jgi:hypothetical protein
MRFWHFMRCCSANTMFLDAATELIVQVGAIKTVYFSCLVLLMNSIFILCCYKKRNVRIVMLLNVNTMLWCCDLIWLMVPPVSYDNKLTKIKKSDLVLLMN